MDQSTFQRPVNTSWTSRPPPQAVNLISSRGTQTTLVLMKIICKTKYLGCIGWSYVVNSLGHDEINFRGKKLLKWNTARYHIPEIPETCGVRLDDIHCWWKIVSTPHPHKKKSTSLTRKGLFIHSFLSEFVGIFACKGYHFFPSKGRTQTSAASLETLPCDV